MVSGLNYQMELLEQKRLKEIEDAKHVAEQYKTEAARFAREESDAIAARKAKLAKNKSALDAQIDSAKSQWTPSSGAQFRMSTMDNRERMINKDLLQKAGTILRA